MGKQKRRLKPSTLFQILGAGLLLVAAWQKLSGQQVAVETFAALHLGKLGRLSAGISEVLAAVLLCLPTLVWAGALIGISQLGGAILFYGLVTRYTLPHLEAIEQLGLALAGMGACMAVLTLRLLGR